MKSLVSYIFWKNVYHHQWLYRLAIVYFYCFNKKFREEARLFWACLRVERQDTWRVYVDYTLKPLFKSIREISNIIAEVNFIIKN